MCPVLPSDVHLWAVLSWVGSVRRRITDGGRLPQVTEREVNGATPNGLLF